MVNRYGIPYLFQYLCNLFFKSWEPPEFVSSTCGMDAVWRHVEVNVCTAFGIECFVSCQVEDVCTPFVRHLAGVFQHRHVLVIAQERRGLDEHGAMPVVPHVRHDKLHSAEGGSEVEIRCVGTFAYCADALRRQA